MNRPQKIREVFYELRRVLGDEIASGELLLLAAKLVQSYIEPESDDVLEQIGIEKAQFFAAEVDKAMADGGWHILSFEQKEGMALTDELPENQEKVRIKIKGYVGRIVWPRSEMD